MQSKQASDLTAKEFFEYAPVFGAFTSKSFFIRECYSTMAENTLSKWIKLGTIAVLGDPGIGKSSFCDFCFFYFVLAKKKKVIKVMEDGTWIIGDGNEDTGVAKYVAGTREELPPIWKQDEVLLLLDGSVDPLFLPKTFNAIVFASSRKKNYQKFIKNSGTFVIMNPWSWEEVKVFSEKYYDKYKNTVLSNEAYEVKQKTAEKG